MDKNNKNNSKISRKDILSGLSRVAFSSSIISNLPEIQQEILYYLCVKCINAPKIAKLRKTSPQAVRKIIGKLRNKGIITNNNLPILEIEIEGGSSTLHPKAQPLKGLRLKRLHGQNMTVKILSTSTKYMKILNNKSKHIVKKNTIMLYRRKLIIYSNKSFYDTEPSECLRKSNDYWNQILRILENDLGVVLINGEKTNIYQFRCHLADVDNPLAIKVIKAKLIYRVIDDLGEERIIIDNSKGLFEKETTHKDLCIDDMKKLGEFELDIINKEGLKPSEAKEWIESFSQSMTKQQSQHNELLLMFKAQLKINETLQLEIIKLKNK